MYEFWYDYVKPIYGEKAIICFMDTESFIVYIKIEDIYVDISKNVETRFNTSNYELERPLPRGKNKNLRPKTYSYSTDKNNENKKRHTKVLHIKKA